MTARSTSRSSRPAAPATQRRVKARRQVSLEQSVKDQFARVFPASDWRLFKEMAEIYFSEAAFLKKSAFKVAHHRRLLVRNSRKRLLIGIGAELLLKAVYLKAGYCINKPQDDKAPLRFPFTPAALVELYASAFHEQLTIHFSFEPGDKGAWGVAP